MKYFTRFIFLLTFSLVSYAANSQVLISLLFGEKLNSDKIEFGLIGGFNWSNLNDLEKARVLTNFNLGFYFHFRMKQNSFFSTGVLVKSDLGATGMDTYPIGNAEFDSVYVDGTLTKKVSYIQVPILYHYRIKELVYLEAGFMIGLRTRADDIFTKSGDMEFDIINVKIISISIGRFKC